MIPPHVRASESLLFCPDNLLRLCHYVICSRTAGYIFRSAKEACKAGDRISHPIRILAKLRLNISDGDPNAHYHG